MIVSLILVFSQLVQYSNTYHHSIIKKPINGNFSALTEKIETNPIASKFKVNNTVRIRKYQNLVSKVYTVSWSREIFIIGTLLKTNSWTYESKDLNKEKTKAIFYQK